MEPCELSPSGVFDLYSCRSSKLLQKCNVVLNYAETFYKSNVNCTFFLYKNKFQKRRVWTCGVLKGGGGVHVLLRGWGGWLSQVCQWWWWRHLTWEGGIVFWTHSEVEGHFTHDALCVKANIWLTHVTPPSRMPQQRESHQNRAPRVFPRVRNGVKTVSTHPRGAHTHTHDPRARIFA